MKLIKLNCNNCNAPLEINIDKLQAYCPYCGQKLLFDLDQMQQVLAEKEKTKRARERTKQAEEETKRVQMKYEYEDKKDRRVRASEWNDMIFAVIVVLLSVLVCWVFPALLSLF